MTMSPPYRPRGEKPATTIRYQRQQIAQMADRLADQMAKLTIAQGKMGDAQTLADQFEKEADYLEQELSDAHKREANLTRQLAAARLSLAYYAGYHAGAENNRLPTQTVTVRRPGDPQTWTPGETAGEEGGTQEDIFGLHQEPGRTTWRHHALHPTDLERAAPDRQEERASEDFTIGAVHDGPIHPRRARRQD